MGKFLFGQGEDLTGKNERERGGMYVTKVVGWKAGFVRKRERGVYVVELHGCLGETFIMGLYDN